MTNPYFDKKKHKMFPWIKDFHDPQNHLRYANTNKLNYMEWFWFHPSAFNLLFVGIPTIAFIVFGVGTMFVYSKGNFISSIILLLLSLLMLWDAYRKTNEIKLNKYRTFYDMFVREY